jgi:hypothetical protein
MQDDNITQSVNDLVSQPDEPRSNDSPALGLGVNPSDQADSRSAENDMPTLGQSLPEPASEEEVASPQDAPTDSANSELNTIKQQALAQLAPIVDKLDQSPEEKFRTLMMMIQSSDDQTQIRAAFEAASVIEDDTKKAQALLGIINEIDYFTQK